MEHNCHWLQWLWNKTLSSATTKCIQNKTIYRKEVMLENVQHFFPFLCNFTTSCKSSSSFSSALNTFQFEMACLITQEKIIITLELFFWCTMVMVVVVNAIVCWNDTTNLAISLAWNFVPFKICKYGLKLALKLFLFVYQFLISDE